MIPITDVIAQHHAYAVALNILQALKCIAFRESALTGNPVHSGILPSLPDDLSYNHFQDTSRHLDEPAMLPQSPLSYANTVYAVLWDDLLMFRQPRSW